MLKANHFLPLMACSLVLLSACNHPTASIQAPPPVAVRTQPMQAQNVADSTDFIATLISRQSVILQSQVQGQITQIAVKPGQHVHRGQLLMLIDPRQPQAEIASSNASAQAQRGQITQAMETLHALQEQQSGLQSALVLSQRQYQRYSRLLTQRSASQQDVDRYFDEQNRAQAALLANQAQLKAQQATILSAQKQYDQALSTTQERQVQLQYHRILAPFTGEIGDIPVKLGNLVQPLTQLVSVTDNNALEINMSVPSERAAELKTGLPLEILDEGGINLLGKTTLSFVSPRIDALSQTILVKAILKNPTSQFKADQVVNARLLWRSKPGYHIPIQSVLHMGGRDFVFVTQPDATTHQWIAHQKPVKIGQIDGPNYTVESGLQAGEQLVVSGIQKLSDGAPVSITTH